MNKIEIINYLKSNGEASVAVIQKNFGIPYKQAKEIIDELTENGDLVYAGGVSYKYTGGEVRQEQDAEENVTDNKEELSYIRAQLEARRRELIARMKAEADDDDEDDDEDDEPFAGPEDFDNFLKENFPDANSEASKLLWLGQDEFENAVEARKRRIITSDAKIGLKGAVKTAEACLEAVRDTNDCGMTAVYERLVYELRNMSAYEFYRLKKFYKV